MQKIVIKLKSDKVTSHGSSGNGGGAVNPKVKISLRVKNNFSLSVPEPLVESVPLPVPVSEPEIKKETQSIKVRYLFLEEGEFLYDERSFKLYSLQKPHKYVGYICQESLNRFFETT